MNPSAPKAFSPHSQRGLWLLAPNSAQLLRSLLIPLTVPFPLQSRCALLFASPPRQQVMSETQQSGGYEHWREEIHRERKNRQRRCQKKHRTNRKSPSNENIPKSAELLSRRRLRPSDQESDHNPSTSQQNPPFTFVPSSLVAKPPVQQCFKQALCTRKWPSLPGFPALPWELRINFLHISAESI